MWLEPASDAKSTAHSAGGGITKLAMVSKTKDFTRKSYGIVRGFNSRKKANNTGIKGPVFFWACEAFSVLRGTATCGKILRMSHREPKSLPDPFRLLLDGIADYAVFLLDDAGCVSRWSSAAEKLFGYKEDEILGKHVSCLHPSGEADRVAAGDELTMAAAHGRWEDVAWRQRRDQSRFWADYVICPLRDEKTGEIAGYSEIIRDISERKKAEDELRFKEEQLSQARKMEAMGRLAGGVAHDFNNFLTGIVGLAEEVRDTLPEQDARWGDLNDIVSTADKARRLVQDLLAFGRRQISAPQVLDLNVALREREIMLRRLLGSQVRIEMHLDAHARCILIDPMQLDQILINLTLNARDAMPQGGVIQIKTLEESNGHSSAKEKTDTRVQLLIQDTGIGMEESVLSRVFEPFFTTKEQGKGTGLGLATVYGIIQQNHGEISVASRVGEGTVFKMKFPVVADLPEHKTVERPLPKTEGTETILVVEDTEIVQQVVARALKKAGYQTLVASNASEALGIASQHTGPIQLMLTDVVMRGMDGRQLAKQLHTLRPDTSVLLMSAYAEALVREGGPVASGVQFIGKPFTTLSLLTKVREVLDARRSTAPVP